MSTIYYYLQNIISFSEIIFCVDYCINPYPIKQTNSDLSKTVLVFFIHTRTAQDDNSSKLTIELYSNHLTN